MPEILSEAAIPRPELPGIYGASARPWHYKQSTSGKIGAMT